MVPRDLCNPFFQSYQKLRKKSECNFVPEFIVNIDETIVDVITNPQKVILFKDDLDPVVTEAKKLEHITLS